MFVLRLIVLAFLAFYSYSMGQERGGLNAFGEFVVFSGIVFIPALYMLPTFEAWLRKHPNLTSIALLNLFLGWTLLGWVAAIVWAFKKQEPQVMASVAQAYDPVFPPKESRQTKACPYCAEEVLVAAVKCKHCGSEIPAS
ncbi:superinfection immunity protein [Pseudomonas poae]|nr:superinfection immunity protein [Pseudomonas poae]